MSILLAAVLTLSSWQFAKDGGAFETVRVPHDWAIAGPFDPNAPGGSGKLPWIADGEYRTVFNLETMPGHARLEFDGVMAWPEVFVNGRKVGGWDFGYMSFTCDVTDAVKAGANEVVVKASTRPHRSRWYPGGGIYREVRLVTDGRDHLEPGSVFIRSKVSRSGTATVTACWTMSESGPQTRTIEMENPRLWSLDDPHLYSIEIAGRTFRYGIRTAEWTADDGFHLNGRRVRINGVNLHSDLGPLGMAFDRDAAKRQLLLMKDMGVNAVRTSHNAPDPKFLDLCDEMGLLVWNECFDKWNETAGRKPEQNLEEFVVRNLRQFVRRDRNHPCVVCWSVSNEISPVGSKHGDANGQTRARNRLFVDTVKALDPTRPVTAGLASPDLLSGDFLDDFDIQGWNYERSYAAARAKYPKTPLVYSESASAVSSYGFYRLPPTRGKTDFPCDIRQADGYDLTSAWCGDIPDVEFDRVDHDGYLAGEFVWTGIDYLGEPNPFVYIGRADCWPGPSVPEATKPRSSYFGIADLCCVPKDRFYLYRSRWNASSETTHIVPQRWNWEPRRVVPVFVYTSGDSAELFLNGRSLGIRKKTEVPDYPLDFAGRNPDHGDYATNDYYRICRKYRLRWDVPFEPGELRTVSYRGGVKVGEDLVLTADTPERLSLSDDRFTPRGSAMAFVHVDAVDAKGVRSPTDSREVRFRIDGDATIVSVGNGDPMSFKSFKATESHPLHFGKAVVYIRRGTGDSSLIAESDGVVSAEIRISGAAAETESGSDTVPIVSNGVAKACIVLPDASPKCCRAAASEFARWTKELTGATIPVAPSAVPGLVPIVLRLDPSDARVRYDGFRLVAAKDGISIVAREPFGIVHSAYWILNRFGKIWWCEPESGADFAKTDSFAVPAGVYEENPLPHRNGLRPGAARGELRRKISLWNLRNGFLRQGVDDDVAAEFGMEKPVSRGGHAMGDMVMNTPVDEVVLAAERNRVVKSGENKRLLDPSECDKPRMIDLLARYNLMLKNNPEMLPLIDGRRCPTGVSLRGPYRGKVGNPCLSNAATRERILAAFRALKAEAAEKAGGRVKFEVDFICDDNSQWCECDECMKLIKSKGASTEDGRASDYWWQFLNWITPRLLEDPDVSVQAGIYLTYRQPPTRVKPFVVDPLRQSVLVCPHGRCYFHSLTNAACKINPRYVKMFDDWTRLGIPVRSFEYHCQLPGKANYAFVEKSWIEDLKWYRANGISHTAGGLFGPWISYYCQGSKKFLEHPIYRYGAKARWQIIALTGHFAWDTGDDFETVRREMLTAYYRSAAKEMLEYRALLENALARANICMSYGSSGLPFMVATSEPGFVENALSLLDAADRVAGDDIELRRRIAMDKFNFKLDWESAASLATNNLVSNPSFEVGGPRPDSPTSNDGRNWNFHQDEAPAGWRFHQNGGDLDWRTDDGAPDGRRYIRVSPINNNGGPEFIVSSKLALYLPSTSAMKVSFAARGKGSVRICSFAEKGLKPIEVSLDSAGWRRYEADLPLCGTHPTSLALRFVSKGSDPIDFDDFAAVSASKTDR